MNNDKNLDIHYSHNFLSMNPDIRLYNHCHNSLNNFQRNIHYRYIGNLQNNYLSKNMSLQL